MPRQDHDRAHGDLFAQVSQAGRCAGGAKIGIPNDPANESRVLLLLQKQGIIKLREASIR
jgi:ABC-type metal ion transport system substrate-binding protein